MRIGDIGDDAAGHGPVYLAVERALWALAPAILLVLALNLSATRAVRQQAEIDRAKDVAAENLEYCAKWGMPAGTRRYADCVQDLTNVRARAEGRARDSAAARGF